MNSEPHIPAAGRIDLHCHLLPGVDDGCQTREQSLECVARWMEAGFVGSVCTPHVGPNWFQSNTPDNIDRWVLEFRQTLAEAGLAYHIWDGGEVRISEETIEWFSYWGLPTLGPGRCVLLDWWGEYWPEYAADTLRFLVDNGYQPILAHPERMGLSERDLQRVLDELHDMGAWLQGNLNSLSGGEGEQALRRAKRLLREDRYFVLATDTHMPASVPARLAGLEDILAEFGAERISILLEDRPREVLQHNAH
jgi:protein-tyrosine phosphatase